MKNQYLCMALVICLFVTCEQPPRSSKSISNQQIASNLGFNKSGENRLVLLGGTLISQMENHGYFESAMLRHLPEFQISTRNIGWPADDVFGLARSQFGSAQNTRSWQPPSAEEGFGSKVLMQHIVQAAPTQIIVGYGGEVAYMESDVEFEIFSSGYERLLEFIDSLDFDIILLTPPRQEKVFIARDIVLNRNEQLKRVRDFIVTEGKEHSARVVDLYEQLVVDPEEQKYTENGVQLNAAGYRKMSNIIFSSLDLAKEDAFYLEMDSLGNVLSEKNVRTDNWRRTVRGLSFDLTTDVLQFEGQIKANAPFAVYVDGELISKGEDVLQVCLPKDSIQVDRLMDMIYEKNQLHRYRLRPLNEAYIYLFRRHEMGHLAYEMEDLSKLVAEREYEINYLLKPNLNRVEVEFIKPWQPPRDYPEHEVPAFIPEPNIQDEIEAFTLSSNLEINVFAADPMIANPIYVTWDNRGRAWVATSSTYPHIIPGKEPNDKIIILEDTDHDGQADKSTIFAEGLLVPHSVMPVEGGAYVASTTEILFFSDDDQDDQADGRTVVFDGFGNADVHHMIHGFRWAPWGDLFFTQSIYINTFIETVHGIQIMNGSGIWKLRPENQKLDVFSRGLINPWGHAFDEWGQAFATDGAGSSGVNYVFPESAHATAVGAAKVLDGLNIGTPKNTAAEVIYSRHLPSNWQGSIITSDFRANRTVRYKMRPESSGYTSEEVETVAHSDHRSYRPVDIKVGPDGALYIVDWYNPIIDHGEVDFHHPIRDKSHGRIWRITNKNKPTLPAIDFTKLSNADLLQLLKSPEQFIRLQTNRTLVQNKCRPEVVVNWINNLNRSDRNFERNRLEGMWLETALNYLDKSLIRKILASPNARARAAGIRVLSHWKLQEEEMDLLNKLIDDPHPQVRLETVHALRELGTKEAAEKALMVLNQPLDENLEFAAWLTAKNTQQTWLPSATDNQQWLEGNVNNQMFALLACDNVEAMPQVLALISAPDLDLDRKKEAWHMLARLGGPLALDQVLEEAIAKQDVKLLRSMVQAPVSNKSRPTNEKQLEKILQSDQVEMKVAATDLIGRWQMASFLPQLAAIILQSELASEERKAAGKALLKLDHIKNVEQAAVGDYPLSVRLDASAVWVEHDPSQAVDAAVELLNEVEEADLAEGLFLTFRRIENGPTVLQKALADQSIPEAVASVGLKVIQSSGLDLSDLETAIREAGSIEPVGMDMSVTERSELLKDAAETGDRHRGRNIYNRPQILCGTCHKINNIGGLIGPDLTTVGSYMTPSSLLESLLNPSKDIKQGYETVILNKINGEVLSGTLYRKTDRATLIRIATGEIISVPAEEIDKIDVSPVSLMPAGLTASLHRDELKDLLHYLTTLGVEN